MTNDEERFENQLAYMAQPNQYIVVIGNTPEQLIAKVFNLMKEGWECQGGVAVDSIKPQQLFQAMVRYVDPALNPDAH